jgi:hypothetical protein
LEPVDFSTKVGRVELGSPMKQLFLSRGAEDATVEEATQGSSGCIKHSAASALTGGGETDRYFEALSRRPPEKVMCSHA